MVSAFRDFDDNDCHQWQDIWIFFLAPESAALIAGLLWRFVWSTDEPGEDNECQPKEDECETEVHQPVKAPPALILTPKGASAKGHHTIVRAD